MTLREIYETLVACDLDIRQRLSRPGGELHSEVEDTTRSTLAQLRRFVIQHQEYRHLNYHLNQAIRTLDLTYILDELEKILGD